MKEFDEARRKIDSISPSGVLQTQLVDAMNSLLKLVGSLMSDQAGAAIDIKPMMERPTKTPVIDPRSNPNLKPEPSESGIKTTLGQVKEKSK